MCFLAAFQTLRGCGVGLRSGAYQGLPVLGFSCWLYVGNEGTEPETARVRILGDDTRSHERIHPSNPY